MKGLGNWAQISRSISSSFAMNPALLAVLLVTVPSLIMLGLVKAPLIYFFMLMAAGPVLVTLWQIVRFTRTDPWQLRNDRHVERMTELRLGQRTDDGLESYIVPLDGPLIDNPTISSNDGVVS